MKVRMNSTVAMALGCAAVLCGCKATPPGKWETAAMTKLKHSITVRGKDAKNPLEDTPDKVENGRTAFSHYCAACHGFDGQNTGVPFADRMAPPVPPLNSLSVQSYTDGQLHWILENGVSPSGMPGSKGILTDRELWSIVVYVRHLPSAGSLGEPAMYSGEGNPAPCPTPPAHAR
jgi:mono/diheme cytochrome c family protein